MGVTQSTLLFLINTILEDQRACHGNFWPVGVHCGSLGLVIGAGIGDGAAGCLGQDPDIQPHLLANDSRGNDRYNLYPDHLVSAECGLEALKLKCGSQYLLRHFCQSGWDCRKGLPLVGTSGGTWP